MPLSACAAFAPRRFESVDPRADGRRRVVEVAPNAIVIIRAVSGVAMRIALPPTAFRGVCLALRGYDDGAFRYEARLLHRDPDLSVVLAQSTDRGEIECEWRAWASALRLAPLVERVEGEVETADVALGAIGYEAGSPRRRGGAVAARRPRFLVRRKVGRRSPAPAVHSDEPTLFFGWRPDG